MCVGVCGVCVGVVCTLSITHSTLPLTCGPVIEVMVALSTDSYSQVVLAANEALVGHTP